MELKKNDKVKYVNNDLIMYGVVSSCTYYFVTEKRRYVDVYFKQAGLYLPLPIDLLEKI